MADILIIGYIFDPDEGQVVFDGIELSQDFVYGDMDIGRDRFLDQAGVGCDHGFVGVVANGLEFRGIDITVHEEGIIGIGLGQVVQVFPFFVCAVEVIINCDPDDFGCFHGNSFLSGCGSA
jgi:hypothetical protein